GVPPDAQSELKPATPRSPWSYEGTSAITCRLDRGEASTSVVAACLALAEGAPASLIPEDLYCWAEMTSEPVARPALPPVVPLPETCSPTDGPVGANGGVKLPPAPVIPHDAQPHPIRATPRSPGSYQGFSAVASFLDFGVLSAGASDFPTCMAFAAGACASPTPDADLDRWPAMPSEPVPQPALAPQAPLAEIQSPRDGPVGANDGAKLPSAQEEVSVGRDMAEWEGYSSR
ncbi:Protein of unknown function, partial [Gryllus bimaculatus]